MPEAHRTLDGVFTTLACDAAVDGLYSDRTDDDSTTVRRLARILGSTPDKQRRLRGVLAALYRIRSEVAHGRRPPAEHVRIALGGAIPEPDDLIATMKWREDLRWLAL